MNPNPAPAPPAARPRANAARRHSRRWLPWLALALLLALIVAGFWPKPVLVETATVAVGPLRAVITEEGRTRIKHRYLVSAPVSGQLRRLTLDPGDDVCAGETVVAVIEPLPPALLDARSRQLAAARRDAAAEQVERARAARRYATSELQRFEKLFADGTVSIQELEVAQWRAEAATRELGVAEGALREAEAALAEFDTAAGNPAAPRAVTEVKAPAGGRVLRVFDHSARVVTAGTPLLEIGDPAELEVLVEVLSRDGAALQPGTPVELGQWGGTNALQARVRLVEPAAFTKVSALGVEEQRVNVIADLVSPPEERRGLGDGFRVEARIVVWEAAQVVKVPAGALFRRGADWAAFVVVEGRARLRRVKVGQSGGGEMQILDGLQLGEGVILHPGDRIRDGQRVRPTSF
jgi:HlyD family secretion protein